MGAERNGRLWPKPEGPRWSYIHEKQTFIQDVPSSQGKSDFAGVGVHRTKRFESGDGVEGVNARPSYPLAGAYPDEHGAKPCLEHFHVDWKRNPNNLSVMARRVRATHRGTCWNRWPGQAGP